MAAPDENTWKIIDHAWALVGGLIVIAWNLLNGKMKAENQALHKRIDDVDTEINLQRVNVAKLFDKLEEHSKASTERHIELLQYLRDKH